MSSNLTFKKEDKNLFIKNGFDLNDENAKLSISFTHFFAVEQNEEFLNQNLEALEKNVVETIDDLMKVNNKYHYDLIKLSENNSNVKVVIEDLDKTLISGIVHINNYDVNKILEFVEVYHQVEDDYFNIETKDKNGNKVIIQENNLKNKLLANGALFFLEFAEKNHGTDKEFTPYDEIYETDFLYDSEFAGMKNKRIDYDEFAFASEFVFNILKRGLSVYEKDKLIKNMEGFYKEIVKKDVEPLQLSFLSHVEKTLPELVDNFLNANKLSEKVESKIKLSENQKNNLTLS